MTPRRTFMVRAIVLWTLRAVSVGLMVFGSYLVMKRILFALGSGMGTEMLRTWDSSGEEHSFYRGAGLVVVGAALAVVSSAVSRWIVPGLAYCCPKCGYEPPKREDAGRCPECGMDEVFAGTSCK